MKRKVFGIGWAKTGTTTLGCCLKTLGYKHMSQRRDLIKCYADRDFGPIMQAARQVDSVDDWPWILLYRELDSFFPGSLFVLTTREPQRWLASYRNMLSRPETNTEELNSIRKQLYNLDFPCASNEQLLERYLSHNKAVISYFDNRKSDLLIVDWEKGDGWPELCRFTNSSLPGCDFPHENRGSYPPMNSNINNNSNPSSHVHGGDGK